MKTSIFTLNGSSNSIYLNPIDEHLIFRSENGGILEYILIATDSSVHSFIDQNVNIQTVNMIMLIINKNICDVNSNSSNLGNSILLNFERLDNFRTKLDWNFTTDGLIIQIDMKFKN